MPNDTIVQRWGHSAASLTVTPECEEVVLFGGQHTYFGSVIGETTVLRFGRYLLVYYNQPIICIMLHIGIIIMQDILMMVTLLDKLNHYKFEVLMYPWKNSLHENLGTGLQASLNLTSRGKAKIIEI